MRPMVLLFVALFISILGLSILFPVFGPLGRELGLADFEIGILSSAYPLMQLLLAPMWGRRSERVGRKPVLVTGVIGFAVGFAAFGGVAELGMRGLIGHWTLLGLLFLTRLIGGAFSSATLPTAQAYAADLTDRDSRTGAMAVVGAAFGLGVIFGPGIGAGVSYLTGSLLAPVYCSAAVAVLNAVFIVTGLKEPSRAPGTSPPRTTAELRRRLSVLLGIALVATLASVAMEQTIAFYFQDRLGLEEADTPPYVGLALVAYGVVAVVAQGFIVRRLKLSPLALLRFGLPVVLIGYVCLPLAHSFGAIVAALVVQGLGQGLLLPAVTSAVSLSVSTDEQGLSAGLNSSATGFGRLLGPTLGTALYQLAPELPYALSAVLICLLGGLILLRPSVVPRP